MSVDTESLLTMMREVKFRQTPNVFLLLPHQMKALREEMKRREGNLFGAVRPDIGLPKPDLLFMGLRLEECLDSVDRLARMFELQELGERVGIITEEETQVAEDTQ